MVQAKLVAHSNAKIVIISHSGTASQRNAWEIIEQARTAEGASCEKSRLAPLATKESTFIMRGLQKRIVIG